MLKINFYQWWIMHWYYLGKSHILLNCFEIRIKRKTEKKWKNRKQNGKRKMGEGRYSSPAQPTSYLPLIPLCSDRKVRYSRRTSPAVPVAPARRRL
jgi:hypothetical protein